MKLISRIAGFGKKITKTITFMIVPESQHAIVRFRIPGVILVLAPFLFVFVSGLAYFSYMSYSRTAATQNQLQDQLKQLSAQYESDLQDKDNQISHLQGNVQHLSQQADEMKTKVDELKQLESDIKSLTNYAPNTTSNTKRAHPVEVASASADGMGGADGNDATNEAMDAESLSATGSDAETSVTDPGDAEYAATEQQYNDLYDEVDQLIVEFSDAKQTALNIQAQLAVTPSIWPTISRRITSPFGWRRDPFTKKSSYHDGVDIGGRLNDPVFTVADGVITYTGYDHMHGNNIIVQHQKGLLTRYLHLNKIVVHRGDKVKKGQVIGRLGTTGRSTGPHLHFEVIKDGVIVNPMPYTHPDTKG